MTLRTRIFSGAGFLCLAFSASAQILITNGVQTYPSLAATTVTMSNRCELWLTNAIAPLTGCTVNLNSTNAWLLLTGIKPSVAVSTYLAQVRVNGAAAVADGNVRVAAYGMGAVVIPQPPSFQPLQLFSGPHFTGVSTNLGQYVYYTGTGLGALNANVGSFRLKRGYQATLAQNASGAGYSRNYVAADGDLEISLLPGGLDRNVRFVYVTPWRWTSKKGIAGDPGNGQLNLQWWYNWNLDQNSSRDFEYVPIRQQRWWPGLGQDWKARGASQVLGYNEPDKSDQANIAVGDAIYSWPDLLGTGLRVGSPATSDGGWSSWMYPFISQADAAGLRVDYVAVHYYQCHAPTDPAGAASQMYNALKNIYDTVKRPLWITEWNNGANWTSCSDPTYAQQQSCIAAMIAMLDSTPFVERYALYSWVETVRQVTTNGVLTGAGVAYRDEYSPVGYVQALPDTGTRSFTQLGFETNTLDSSGYGNNGVTAGSPAYAPGHSGAALVFDGVNTAVTLPANVAKGSSFTFAAWVYWNGGANWQRIFDFGNSSTHYLFLTPSATGGYLRFGIRNGGAEQTVQTTALSTGTWQHVALTLSGTTAKLYVNGALAAQNIGLSLTPASFSPRQNYLGKSQFPVDPFFNGLMDDVLVTDYALTAAQIAALQTNTPPQFTNNILVRGSATEGVLFSNTIAGAATDTDPGDTLIYSKAVGPAWLNVATNGTLTGIPTSGDGGTNYFTVRATDAAGQNAFALLNLNVTVLTAAGIWTADGNGNWGESTRWSNSIVATGAGQTADFSTINITGNRTVTLEASRAIGNLKFSDTSGAQTWTLAGSGESTLTLSTGTATSPLLSVTNTATISAPLAGTNGFTKTGPGTLIVSGNNPLSGTVNIDTGGSSGSDGILRVVGPNALANASLITINKNNSGTSTLQLDGSTGNITIDANFTVTYRLATAVTIQSLAGTNIFNGNFALFQGGNSHAVQCDSGLVVFTGTNQYVGGLVGIRTNYFNGAGSHLVIGPMLDSTNGSAIYLTKNGTGKLTLAGPNTYGAINASSTMVNGGSLYVDGVLPASPLGLASGTTLGGNGVIRAPVTVPFGVTLAPGDNFGMLVISNNLALAAGSTTRIELDKNAGTNDVLRVTGSCSLGGNLVVTNLGGTLWAGDTFQIFSNSLAPTGKFASTNFPPLPAGFNWNWNPVAGTLSITSTVALNPTNLIANFADGSLQLAWPEDHVGWRLQVQTNAFDAGNWLDVPGSAATNQMIFEIDPANDSVFYRLSFP
jgi:autotransporter-associated beta strand protein